MTLQASTQTKKTDNKAIAIAAATGLAISAVLSCSDARTVLMSLQ
jgi:hypothetical protein